MKIKEILRSQNVIADLKSKTRDEVLKELLEPVAGQIPVPKEKLVQALIDREDQSPTAISGGVAVPHGRIPELDEFILVVGKSKSGIAFGARSGLTMIFFMLMAPVNSTTSHLKILARIARLCRNPGFRDEIMAVASKKDIYEIIIKGDDYI